MNRIFERWVEGYFLADTKSFTLDELREAFEEGYHVAKDEARERVEDIFTY
jgi:hypothetical protein